MFQETPALHEGVGEDLREGPMGVEAAALVRGRSVREERDGLYKARENERMNGYGEHV
jgi:hypothetical protein